MATESKSESWKGQLLWVAGAIVIIAAFYLLMTNSSSATVPPTQNTTIVENFTNAQNLLLKSMTYGHGDSTYTLAYTESVNGYTDKYTLTQFNGTREIDVQSPLSNKNIYILNNGTNIMCITYPINGNQTCSLLNTQDPKIQSYLQSLNSRFPDDLVMQTNLQNAQLLIQKNYIQFSPGSGQIQQNGCTDLNYSIDFSTMTITDAEKFGIGSGSPPQISWAFCIGDDGSIQSRVFNYTYNGIPQVDSYNLIGYQTQASPIVVPQNLSGDSTSLLELEIQNQYNLAACFTQEQGIARDNCVETFAIQNSAENVCDSAGSLMDHCLVAMVPLTKDSTLCANITNTTYQDDCYVELAGIFNNASYCNDLTNTSLEPTCLNLSSQNLTTTYTPPHMVSNGTSMQNSTNSTIEQNLLNLVETSDMNESSTNTSMNSTTNESMNSSG